MTVTIKKELAEAIKFYKDAPFESDLKDIGTLVKDSETNVFVTSDKARVIVNALENGELSLRDYGKVIHGDYEVEKQAEANVPATRKPIVEGAYELAEHLNTANHTISFEAGIQFTLRKLGISVTTKNGKTLK